MGDTGDKRPSTAEMVEKAMRCRQLIMKKECVTTKSRVACPTLTDRVRHSVRGPPTVHYLTSGPLAKVSPPRTPSYAAPTHRWTEAVGLRERLKVTAEEPWRKPRPQQEVKRIRVKFVRKKYQEEVKKRTLTNILAGNIGDLVKKKEENDIIAHFVLEEGQKEIEKASRIMAEFLLEEQKKSEELTKKIDEILEAKKKRERQIESEKKKMSEIKLKIFHQNEYLEKIRLCRDFVLNVAEDQWKNNYEKEIIKRKEEIKDTVFKLNKAFGNYKTSCAGEDPGLEKVLEDFIEEFSKAGPPSLPHQDPHKVFNLFKDLEMKSLRALHHNGMLKRAVEKAKAVCIKCDNYIKNEKEGIDGLLMEIRNKIEKEKRGVEEKKELLKNLKKGPIKSMVASEAVLVEYVLIKEVYEELVDSPREGLDTLEMLQDIGELYFDLNRRLEKLPVKEKKSMELQVRNSLDRSMRDAERAERRKRQIEAMVRSLRRAREKPWVKTGRPLNFRSAQAESRQRREDRPEAQRPCGLVLEEDLQADFGMVYAVNHPGPGPYRRPTSPAVPRYKDYYPDLKIVDTDEDAALISESEEEKDGKKKADPAEERKKVKRKKPKKIADSDSE